MDLSIAAVIIGSEEEEEEEEKEEKEERKRERSAATTSGSFPLVIFFSLSLSPFTTSLFVIIKRNATPDHVWLFTSSVSTGVR